MEDNKNKILSIQQDLEKITNELTSINNQVKNLLVRQEDLQLEKKRLSEDLDQLEIGQQNEMVKICWEEDTFPWSAHLENTLKQKFKINNFRQLQKETMNVTLSGYDCLLIMPTGGGKSLCFQLPAVLSDKGFTLVISPLISLMEDQLLALSNIGINATVISSSIAPKEVTVIQNMLIDEQCPFKLVYVTPERIAKSKRFMAKLEKAYTMGNVKRIVIDEVHCASHWGHDFRPDYKILGIMKRQFPKSPILGLTATASKKVLEDVKDMLNLDRSCIVFRASFNRPNLFYEVHHTCLDSKELVKEIAKTIEQRFSKMSGIVYCFSRKDSEEVARGLFDQGITAHCYHSDLDAKLKSNIHQRWSIGKIQVIVATIAFGMGIDKPDVRFVIHYSVSKSIENYYQESGRAGRDGRPAWCILYFRFQDIFRQSSMVFTEKTGLQNLHKMIQYCINKTTCRRLQIGRYFSEEWKAEQCQKMCDVCECNIDTKEVQLNQDAKALLKIVEKARGLQERLTPLKLVDLWLGKGRVSLRGELTSHSREVCETVVTKLLLEQVLVEDYHFTPYNTITYILPGPTQHLIKTDELNVQLTVACKVKTINGSKRELQDNSNGHDKDSFETKKKKQKKKKNALVIDVSDDDL